MLMFILGFVSCMIFDIILSFVNYIIEKSLYYRDLRKDRK